MHYYYYAYLYAVVMGNGRESKPEVGVIIVAILYIRVDGKAVRVWLACRKNLPKLNARTDLGVFRKCGEKQRNDRSAHDALCFPIEKFLNFFWQNVRK